MLCLWILKIVKLATRIKYFNLSDKTNLKRSNNYVALSNLSIYNIWQSIRKLYKNNKFKVSTPAWNDKFELPDGSYYVSDIQDDLLFWVYNEKRWSSD